MRKLKVLFATIVRKVLNAMKKKPVPRILGQKVSADIPKPISLARSSGLPKPSSKMRSSDLPEPATYSSGAVVPLLMLLATETDGQKKEAADRLRRLGRVGPFAPIHKENP